MAGEQPLSSDFNFDEGKISVADDDFKDAEDDVLGRSESAESGFFVTDGNSRPTSQSGLGYGSIESRPTSQAGLSSSVGSSGLGGRGGSPEAVAMAAPSEEQRRAWAEELLKVEEETRTLRLVMQAKMRRAAELKRQLGITQLDEFKADVSSTLKTIKESESYQKTSSTLQNVSQKTGRFVSDAAAAAKKKYDDSQPSRQRIGGQIYSAVDVTGSYVSRSVEDVRASPTFQAVGASVSSTWAMLRSKVMGGGAAGVGASSGDGGPATASASDTFLGDVVEQGGSNVNS